MRFLPSPAGAEARRLTDLQLWAVSSGASAWLLDLEPYQSCRVVGVVQQLRVDPVNRHIEVTITDGTGELVAHWAIRRPTPQLAVAPGRGVVLEGVPIVGRDGALVVRDPAFETIPLPDLG